MLDEISQTQKISMHKVDINLYVSKGLKKMGIFVWFGEERNVETNLGS